MIAREFTRLKEIEAEKAKARLVTSTGGTNPQPRANLPTGEEGRAGDIAAKALGISRRTAEKAETVVRYIDAATEQGDTEKVERLREQK